MALPTKEERIRRKKVMLAAGIRVPNTNASWGPWWDKLWKKAITHTKTNDYYGVPSVWNLIRRTWDEVTNNTTYEAEPLPIGGTLEAADESVKARIKRTLNNWQHLGDPVRDIVMLAIPNPSKPVKAVAKAAKAAKAVPKLFTKAGAKQAAARTAETVIREIPRGTAGYFAGKGIDELSRNITGKSWAENASDIMSDMAGFHIDPIFGDLTNPGYIFGYKWMDRGIRRAAFNNITPFSYTDKAGTLVLPTTKSLEAMAVIKDLPKLLLSLKPIETPVWRQNLESLSGYIPNEYNIFKFPISDGNLINNREEAMRLVFKLPSKYPLYRQNNNGTVSYDLETIINLLPSNFSLVKDAYSVSPSGEASIRYTYRPRKTKIGYWDNLGFNGGFINYQNKNGVSYISDVFDVLPFLDSYRTANIFGTGNFMHKYFPDFEAFTALGGKPFKLEMKLPTYVDLYPSF